MTYNNNFSNFNGNPCYTPTSFSDITNPTNWLWIGLQRKGFVMGGVNFMRGFG